MALQRQRLTWRRCFHCSPFTTKPCKGGRLTARSTPDKGAGISEDVLARLKAAEDEAASLRRQLAAAQKQVAVPEDVIQAKPKRIDSVDKRETVFDVIAGKQGAQRASWLNEADVDFFTGGGSGEPAPKEKADPEMQATVQRRLLIGILATAALGAFALVPTEQLRLKPGKPQFFYVVPLLRIKDLLAECKPAIEDADWPTLRTILPRVTGPPNNAKENLDNVIALFDDTRTAARARELASQFLEYMEAVDYNKYFEVMPRRAISGSESATFAQFSSRALVAAQGSLDAFLALVPATVRLDAQAQMQLY